MRILFLDAFSGVSGDMMLGLLIDLGIDPELLRNQLAALPVEGYALRVQPSQRHGIGGTKVSVDCSGQHTHRSWSAIDRMLKESTLAPEVKILSRKIFRRLGDAEATVHRVPLDEVHFHEVGAVDAIVDIVGTAVGLCELNLNRIVCAPLPLSRGLTHGHHGALPLPAPATLQLLKGVPVRDSGSDRELVTPTGAAIVASVANFGSMPEMSLAGIGYGVGEWDLADRPNLLRGILGETHDHAGLESDTVVMIETNIDDMPSEWLGCLMDRLLMEGALDATFTALQMKKNRPGTKLSVMAPPSQADYLARLLLRESTAIGVRMSEARRLKLNRETRWITTSIGDVQVKLISEGQKLLRVTPEYESCLTLAAKCHRSLPDVYRLVQGEANRQFQLET